MGKKELEERDMEKLNVLFLMPEDRACPCEFRRIRNNGKTMNN